MVYGTKGQEFESLTAHQKAAGLVSCRFLVRRKQSEPCIPGSSREEAAERGAGIVRKAFSADEAFEAQPKKISYGAFWCAVNRANS